MFSIGSFLVNLCYGFVVHLSYKGLNKCFSYWEYKMSHITGNAVFESFPVHSFIPPEFGTELIYSLVIIVCSLMIYFGTKEFYELTSHKGIKYFRKAFLFFAIAYFCRSFIKFLLYYFSLDRILDISPRIAGPLFGKITLFVFMYFSSMAIFYLLYSVMWKKWKESDKKMYFFHILSFVMAFLIVLTSNAWIYLGVNLFLFFIVLFVVYVSYKSKKRSKKSVVYKHNLYIIYLLLSFFWILNIMDILIPEFFEAFQLLTYVASLVVFLMMLYRVLKKVGSS